MNRKEYRALAFALAFMLVVMALPPGIGIAYAAGETSWKDYAASEYAGGSGTISDPYLISTAEELAKLAQDVNQPPQSSVLPPVTYYRQTADIDLAAHEWVAIGVREYFSGVFDGDGYVIRNMRFSDDDTTMSWTGDWTAGLFGAVTSGVIRNVTLKDIDIENACSWGARVGGLVGTLNGSIAYPGTLENCIVTGNIAYTNSSATSLPYMGGLVGDLSAGAVRNCISAVEVTVPSDLAAANTSIAAAFGNGGSNSTVESCYWNSELTSLAAIGNSTSAAVTAKTTAELQDGAMETALNDWVSGKNSVVKYNPWETVGGDYPALKEKAPLIITSFSTPAPFEAGTAGSAPEVAAVISALPTEVEAYCRIEEYPYNIGPVSIPVTGWLDAGRYDPDKIGVYTFTAELGAIPTGYVNSNGEVAEIDVAVMPDYWTNHLESVSDTEDYTFDGVSTYRIYTARGLAFVADAVMPEIADSGSGPGRMPFEGKTIILEKDLDMGAYYWRLIPGFAGSFQGNGHVISNLKIEEPYTNKRGVGFIGILGETGTVSDLGLVGADVKSESGNGILAADNRGTIAFCRVTGTVSGDGGSGGLVGSNRGTIKNSYADVEVDTASMSGGLAAVNTGTITDCYAAGTAGNPGSEGVAGLVYYNGGTILRSYSAAAVYGDFGSAFCDSNKGEIKDCYYDSDAAGQPDDSGAAAKSAGEMKTASTYENWDWKYIWYLDGAVNSGYPSLNSYAKYQMLKDKDESSNGGGGGGSSTAETPLSIIKDTPAGGTAKITMGSKDRVSTELLSAARNRNVTLSLKYGSFTWTIKPGDMETIPAGTSLDLSVRTITDRTISGLAGGKGVLQLEISHDGKLPFTGMLTVTVGAEQNGKKVYLYYFNEQTGKLESRDSGTVKDGRVSFELNHASRYLVTDAELSDMNGKDMAFSDVKDTSWFYSPVMRVCSEGLFAGTSGTAFSPQASMTRGMFATVLARLSGADLSGYTVSPFSDTAIDKWYGKSVAWAADKGIVSGTGSGMFAPDESITRDQMAVMLYHYIKAMNISLSASQTGQTVFADDAQINDWAKEAVKSMQGWGLISGKPGSRFDPKGTATRAEVAQVFFNYLNMSAGT